MITGLIVIWTSYQKRMRWAWFVMVVFVCVYFVPVHLLDTPSYQKGGLALVGRGGSTGGGGPPTCRRRTYRTGNFHLAGKRASSARQSLLR